MAENNEERTYYVLCADNCKFEGMTKEQIITAIANATGVIPEAIDVDAAFITKIKEMNANEQLKFWVGTEAEYNAISELQDNTLYVITNDSTIDDITAVINGFRIRGTSDAHLTGNTELFVYAVRA